MGKGETSVKTLPSYPKSQVQWWIGGGGSSELFQFHGKIYEKLKKKKPSKTNPLGQVGGFKPHFQESWMRS